MSPKVKEKPKEAEQVLPVPAYQVTIMGTGEVCEITSRERFSALPTVELKAEAFAQITQFAKAVSALKRELEPLMTLALDKARPDASRAVVMPTSIPGVSVVIPKGLEDNDLSKSEVEAFAKKLHDLDRTAYSACIEMEPRIKKTEVNKLRDIPGPVADLIKATYQPHAKKAEVKVKE